jgi:hypothetical protein
MSSALSVLTSDLAFSYVESDIPPGMTVAEWRRLRRGAEQPARRRRTLRARLR